MEPSELRQRKGCFIIKDFLIDRDLPFVQKIMSQVIVTHCKYRQSIHIGESTWSVQVFEYQAISPLFDLCPDNETPPNYLFSQDEEQGLVCGKIGIAVG